MSGPKCSDYGLTAERARRLEEERQRRIEEERKKQEEERRKREEEERRRQEEERRRREEEERRCQNLEQEISLKKASFNELFQSITDELKGEIDEAKNLFTGSLSIDEASFLLSEIRSLGNTLPSFSGERSSSRLSAYLSKIDSWNSNIRLKKDEAVSQVLPKLIQEIKDHTVSVAERNLLSKEFTIRKKSGISLEEERPKPVQEPNIDLQLALKGFNALIFPYLNNPLLKGQEEIEQLSTSIEQIVKDVHWSDEDKIAQIELRGKAFKATKSKYDKEIKKNEQILNQFTNLHDTYLALCNLTGKEPRSFSFSPAKVLALLESLRAEVKEQEEILNRQDKWHYITTTIDEVMSELGYAIVATDHMATPKRNVFHSLYDFKDGNVINAFTSDNGSLMFEVTGISQGKAELSPLDRLKLKENMEDFCRVYPEIKEKLRSKGIVLSKEDLSPADIRYAKVIDISNKKRATTDRQKEGPKRHGIQKPKEMTMR